MPISVDENGNVIVQSQGEILVELNQTFISGTDGIEGFGADFELTDADFTYRQNAILANREANLQAAIAGAYRAIDLNTAPDKNLDIAGSLLTNPRQPATRSTIAVLLRGNPGVAVGDKRVQYSVTDSLWRTPTGAVLGANGTLATTLTAEVTGPLFAAAAASTAWTIVDVTTGWVSVESTADAQRGRDLETADAYRKRIQGDNSGGDATRPAVRKELGLTPGVTAFTADFNDTPLINANGVPPWHFEAVVTGGTDADVATTIYNVIGGTTPTFGNTPTTVVDPVDGAQTVINHSRIVNKQVTASLTLQRSTDSPLPLDAVALSEAAAADRINTNGAGIDVDPGDLLAVAALALPPGTVLVDAVTSVGLVAFKGGVPQATPLVITSREDAFTVDQDQPAVILGSASPATFNLTANDFLELSVNAGATITLTVNVIDYANISAATITEIVSAFSSQATAALIVGSQGGAIAFASSTTGVTSSIVIGAGSAAALLAELGLVVGPVLGTPSDIIVVFLDP